MRERDTDLLFYLFMRVFPGWFLSVPWLGIEPTTGVSGRRSDQLSCPARVLRIVFHSFQYCCRYLLFVDSSNLVAADSLGSKDPNLLSAHNDVAISPSWCLDFSVIPQADEAGLATDYY